MSNFLNFITVLYGNKMETEQNTITTEPIDEIRENPGGPSSTNTPNLSLIDQITMEYMMNRNQKGAVERFFQKECGLDGFGYSSPKKDIRAVEYEIYQEKVKELFSQILEDFISSNGEGGNGHEQDLSSWSSYGRDLKYKFHGFMSAAISYLEENGGTL